MSHEQETYNQIPTSITADGKQLFKEIYGFTFDSAVEIAKTDGEAGKRMRELFTFLHNEEHCNIQDSQEVIIYEQPSNS